MTEEQDIGTEDVAALEPAGVVAERARQKAAAIAEADRIVEASEAKVEKQRGHLASAETALESAVAARKELD